jgi:MATE family multidrug resistance protein
LDLVFAILFLIGRFWFPTLYLDIQELSNQVDNMEVLGLAAELLLVAAFFQISDGLQVVILGALRGLQDVKVPTLITFVAYWIVGFPLSFYLGLYTPLESTGIWIGLLAGLSASALMLYLRFNYMSGHMIRVSTPETLPEQ